MMITLKVQIYLLSTYEVWGSNPEGNDTVADAITRQLDYYARYEGEDYTGVSEINGEGAIKKYRGTANDWWLRSAVYSSSSSFYAVYYNGGGTIFGANFDGYVIGVSPAFRIG